MGSGKLTWLTISILALVMSLVLHFWRLDKAPPSVNWDEAAYGYNAYSLFRTGKDEYGEKLPLALRSFDDYKPPVYAYATAPVVGIWGLNEKNTRTVAAVAGALTVGLVWILVVKIFNKKRLAMITALVVAFSPWSLLFSRLAFEAVLALPLLVASWIYLLKAEKDKKYYLWSVFLAAVSYFTYNSHKVYFGLVVLWVGYRWWITKTKDIKLGLVLAAVVLAVGIGSVVTPAFSRFGSTSVFSLLKTDKNLWHFANQVASRYVSYFSPTNIFSRGTNEPNQRIYDFSVYQPFMAIFYVMGIYIYLKKRHKFSFFDYLLITSPLPAVLTWSWFTPIRVLPFWVMIAVLVSWGIEQVWLFTKGKGLIFGKTLVMLFMGWYLVSSYWLVMDLGWYMPYTEYGKWQWGFREAINIIKPFYNDYDQVVWETPQAQPHMFTLFYLNYSPDKYQTESGGSANIPMPRKNFDFGKFVYRKIYWPTDRGVKKTIFIGNDENLPEKDLLRDGVKVVGRVVDPQGYLVYKVVVNE